MDFYGSGREQVYMCNYLSTSQRLTVKLMLISVKTVF